MRERMDGIAHGEVKSDQMSEVEEARKIDQCLFVYSRGCECTVNSYHNPSLRLWKGIGTACLLQLVGTAGDRHACLLDLLKSGDEASGASQQRSS